MAASEVIRIFGNVSIEIMISSAQSNNTCCVFIETTPPGGGPPPHRHLHEEEIFTVMEGRYDYLRDGTWVPMDVGITILSLRGTVHAFRNVGDGPGKIMCMTNAGGIDRYFGAISKLRMPHDAEKLIEVSADYGYVFDRSGIAI